MLYGTKWVNHAHWYEMRSAGRPHVPSLRRELRPVKRAGSVGDVDLRRRKLVGQARPFLCACRYMRDTEADSRISDARRPDR